MLRASASWLLPLLLGPLLAQDPPQGAPASRPTLRVVEVEGTPFERGFAHGRLLKAEIASAFRTWDAELQKDFAVPLREFVPRFLAKTRFEAAARTFTPELLDEVRGIAMGAEQSYEAVFVWQLVDEIWASAPGVMREKCTSFGVDRDGTRPCFVAQNLDLPPSMHGPRIVLRIRDASRGTQLLVVTEPGLIAAAGMSSARIGVVVNTLLQLRPSREGLPVAFVVRGLLMQPDHASALAFLQRVPHASGQNYTVGGPDTAPGFECSAGKVVRFQPFATAPFTFHTNNPLVNDDFATEYREQATRRGFDPFVGARACPRLSVLQAALTATARPDVDAVKGLLASRTSQPSVNNAMTFASFVMVLGAEPEMQIAPGRPDEETWKVLRF